MEMKAFALLALFLVALILSKGVSADGNDRFRNRNRNHMNQPDRPSSRCRDNSDCRAPAFCQKEKCDDPYGTCTSSAPRCIEEYAPVCGCNGKTYSNRCHAITNRVNIAHEGPCETECFCSSDCAEDEFCSREQGKCREKGVCQKRPQACTLEYTPTCGCDGVTYGNACAVNSGGTSVAYPGNCIPLDDGQCGNHHNDNKCRTNKDCINGGFCQKPKGECDSPRSIGECVHLMAICTKDYRPVCGCDGNTYGNECMALSAGVNIKSDGPCRSMPMRGHGGPSQWNYRMH